MRSFNTCARCQASKPLARPTRQEKRAEATAIGPQGLEVAPFQQRGKESLREVPRVVDIDAATTDVGVEWIPVGLTERCERVARCGRIVAARGHDQAPACRLEAQGPDTKRVVASLDVP